MPNSLECIVCGSCVVDLLCRPINLEEPIGAGVLHETQSVVLTGGGIVINTGVTMARLGASVGALSYVGDDAWAPVIHNLLRDEGVDDSLLVVRPEANTSTTVVAIDGCGERSFFHCVGAPNLLDGQALLDNLVGFERTRVLLVGYYSLMSNLDPDLAEVFKRVRKIGCMTALDAAGSGGSMEPLDRILPHLDVYVPSYDEARHQTGMADPQQIIKAYRGCGAPGLLGVKLGRQGVLLSSKVDVYVHIDAVDPPGEVVDTTGAGDSFYGGLLTGLIRGMALPDAGRLGAASAACCVTAIGGCKGGRDYAFTLKLAGVNL